MRTNGTRWSDKIKPVLHELEERIQRDASADREGVWPEPEEVKAWTARREEDRKKENGRKSSMTKDGEFSQGREKNTVKSRRREGNSGRYCGVSVYEEGETRESIRRKGFAQAIMLQAAQAAAFALATIALLQGIGRVLPDSVTVSNTVNGRELPIYCVQTDEKKVALSFDAAWGNEDTQKILDILKKHNIKVTFFATGGWVESYPDDVKRILAEGHDLGNHSENHKNMSQISDEEKKQEIMDVHTKVQELTGYEMFLFRPPYGDYDNDVIKTVKACGYYPIQWDVDSLDWKDYGVDSIIKTVTEHKHLGNGSIILCHNGAKYTADALDTLITTLEEKGYQIVPISELIYRDNYHLDHEGRQIGN